jgi:site-specific recombinase XerD
MACGEGGGPVRWKSRTSPLMTFAGVACHLAGGELEQIQFLLGHVSVQTTERYPGCKQKLPNAVNDGIDLSEV